MHRAMPFPENDAAVAQLLFRVASEFLVRIPHRHLVQSKPEIESRVAAQMLVREKQDLVAAFQRPSHHS